MKRRSPGIYVIAAALILAIGVPSAAVGFGEGRDTKLGKRNPSSGSLNRETQIIANNGSYGTRQSNKRDGEGGGAIYGCRSSAGKEPCVRANNLKGGRAFEFVTAGKEAGQFQVGDTSAPPFSTNATGKVDEPRRRQGRRQVGRGVRRRGRPRVRVRQGRRHVRRRPRRDRLDQVQRGREHLHRDVQQGRLEVLVHGGRDRRLQRRRRLRRDVGQQPTQVVVDEPDTAGGGAGRDFHLQVIC